MPDVSVRGTTNMTSLIATAMQPHRSPKNSTKEKTKDAIINVTFILHKLSEGGTM